MRKSKASLMAVKNHKVGGSFKQAGAAALEYGLMVSLIAVVILASVTTLGTHLKAAFVAITNIF